VGGEKKTLRIVAEHADIWHSFSDAPTLERKLGILARHGEQVGRDTSEIEISTKLGIRTTVADADEFVALGATLFTIELRQPEYNFAPDSRRGCRGATSTTPVASCQLSTSLRHGIGMAQR
jgi:alkanesulfonate monooxygenase SsuD/methylene tetrahydromethanopterin reductase-like flavin-dependent oxidoreductase (luciferase family)